MSLGAIVAILAVVALLVALGSRDQRISAPAGQPRDPESIESLLASGRKIEAIKAYRRKHGVGLREAKEAVEQLGRERRP